MHAPPRPICTALGERVSFSESPPLSGDKPPSLRSNSFLQNMKEEKLQLVLGGFIHRGEYRVNNPDLQSENE
jgi:hypothetical protein